MISSRGGKGKGRDGMGGGGRDAHNSRMKTSRSLYNLCTTTFINLEISDYHPTPPPYTTQHTQATTQHNITTSEWSSKITTWLFCQQDWLTWYSYDSGVENVATTQDAKRARRVVDTFILALESVRTEKEREREEAEDGRRFLEPRPSWCGSGAVERWNSSIQSESCIQHFLIITHSIEWFDYTTKIKLKPTHSSQ